MKCRHRRRETTSRQLSRRRLCGSHSFTRPSHSSDSVCKESVCFCSSGESLRGEADHRGRAFWQLFAQRTGPDDLGCGRRHAWPGVRPSAPLRGASAHPSPLLGPGRPGAGLSVPGPRPKNGRLKYGGERRQVRRSVHTPRFGRSASSCVYESSHGWSCDSHVTARLHAQPSSHATELQRNRLQSFSALYRKDGGGGTGEHAKQ